MLTLDGSQVRVSMISGTGVLGLGCGVWGLGGQAQQRGGLGAMLPTIV